MIREAQGGNLELEGDLGVGGDGGEAPEPGRHPLRQQLLVQVRPPQLGALDASEAVEGDEEEEVVEKLAHRLVAED